MGFLKKGYYSQFHATIVLGQIQMPPLRITKIMD